MLQRRSNGFGYIADLWQSRKEFIALAADDGDRIRVVNVQDVDGRNVDGIAFDFSFHFLSDIVRLTIRKFKEKPRHE